MRTVTATEASRGFAALLDDIERGETVVITRGGRQVATVSPSSAGNGEALLRLLDDESIRPDPGFAEDVAQARSGVWEGPVWGDA